METWAIILTATIPTVVISTISAWVAKILERKKYLADTVAIEQKNLNTIMETYASFLDNMSNRVTNTLSLSEEKEKLIKEKEKYFVEKDELHQMQIDMYNEWVKQIDDKVSKLLLKSCATMGCDKRIFLNADEFTKVERLFK
jgi:type III secretory pathway component EscR